MTEAVQRYPTPIEFNGVEFGRVDAEDVDIVKQCR